MKAIIYVFSGTGNTAKAAEFFADRLTERGVSVKLRKIEDGGYEEGDIVGIAYPIHAFSAPKNVLDFIRGLPDGKSKVFFIKTGGECLHYNNHSSGKAAKLLADKGYDPVADYLYVMPYNMLYRHSQSMADKMYHTAKRKAKRDVDELLAGKSKRPCGDSLVSMVFRSVEQPFMGQNGRLFRIDENKCVSCLACGNNCPQKNISLRDGKIVFDNKCIGCVRCSFGCPTDAISIGLINMWKVNGKYSFGKEEPESYEVKYLKKSYKKYFDENA